MRGMGEGLCGLLLLQLLGMRRRRLGPRRAGLGCKKVGQGGRLLRLRPSLRLGVMLPVSLQHPELLSQDVFLLLQ